MIEEAIDKIAELAIDKAELEIVRNDALRTVFVRNGKDLKEIPFPAKRRDMYVLGLDDIVAAAKDERVVDEPEVYHDCLSVVVLLDRKDRHERATMTLLKSARFEKLEELEKAHPKISVPGLIRMLRFDLHGIGVGLVIAGLRRLNWTRTSEGESFVEHGNEGLGKKVMSKVQQADQIPEQVTVSLPIYVNPGLEQVSTVEIECGIHIDVEEQTIQIKPMADELTNARIRADREIGMTLRALLQCPIFNGRP